MIPIWLASPGEDFKIEKVNKSIDYVTASGKELKLDTLSGCILSITNKTADTIFGVFHGHRIVFPRNIAMQVKGNVIGKTSATPSIIPATVGHCTGNCKTCGKCH